MTDVDCRSVRDALEAGRRPDDAAVSAHVARCPRCALLLDQADLGRALRAAHRDPHVWPELWENVARRIDSDAGWRATLRSLPTSRRRMLVAGVAVLSIALAIHDRAGLWSRSGLEPVLWLVALGGLMLASTFLLFHPPWRTAARPGRQLGFAMAVAVLPLAYALAAAAPDASQTVSSAAVLRGVKCFAYGFCLAMPFVGLGWLLDRAERIAGERLLLLAGAGALVANLGLSLHCALDEEPHLLVGHASIGLALALALLALRAMAVRR